MIYDSDCQRLLKPIQFWDPGSHFVSLLAHLMDSCYQLACFIIVRTLIEVVFLEKKNYQRVKKKASCTTFPHVSAQNCSGWGSQSHHLASLWLADLANWSPHSFIVLCPCLLGLVFCIFGPFLDHIIKALESSTLRPGRVIHSCNPTIWEVLAGIWGHHFWATWNLVTKQHQ